MNECLSESPTGNRQELAIALLMIAGEQRQNQVSDLGKLGVVLVVGVAEMLDLGHGEFTDTKQASTRGNLITETGTHLSGSEGEAVAIVVEETAVVHEHALSSLGAEEALEIAFGADLGGEHEVEGEGVSEGVAGGQGNHFVLGKQFVELVGSEGVGLETDFLEFQALLLGQRHVLQELVHSGLQ